MGEADTPADPSNDRNIPGHPDWNTGPLVHRDQDGTGDFSSVTWSRKTALSSEQAGQTLFWGFREERGTPGRIPAGMGMGAAP